MVVGEQLREHYGHAFKMTKIELATTIVSMMFNFHQGYAMAQNDGSEGKNWHAELVPAEATATS